MSKENVTIVTYANSKLPVEFNVNPIVARSLTELLTEHNDLIEGKKALQTAIDVERERKKEVKNGVFILSFIVAFMALIGYMFWMVRWGF